MRIPRDVSGKVLIKRLQIFGYAITRQAGSHIRLTSTLKEEHHLKKILKYQILKKMFKREIIDQILEKNF